MISNLLKLAETSYRDPETWNLTVVTTNINQDYTIDINAGTNPNIIIDWGDFTQDIFTTLGLKTHVYATAGTYTVKIKGRFSSGGNIRLGSNVGNQSRLKATGIVSFIPGLINFHATFQGCSGLTGSIPVDLFRYNTLVSTNGFNTTFYGCSGLTGSIPVDLFRYNTLVSTNGFYTTFYGCSGLTGSIPVDLFRYNTAVSTYGFYATFQGCSGLTGSIPVDLFRYNTDCTSFNSVFRNCNKLQLRSDIFFQPGEESTRFLNKSVDFTNAFNISTFTGTQGTAPALWNCNFGTETPTKTACFSGHSLSSVTNFADIPVAWK